jgi:hypothetical protein
MKRSGMQIIFRTVLIAASTLIVFHAKAGNPTDLKPGDTLVITREKLQDKIKGGWAGQTIGVTFGGPYEFKFNGTFIQDYQPLVWYDGYVKKTMLEIPGLYDDL